MRYPTPILAGFVLAVTAGHSSADDATKRTAELQVLDRFMGTWESVVTNKTTGDKSITIEERRGLLGRPGFTQTGDAVAFLPLTTFL